MELKTHKQRGRGFCQVGKIQRSDQDGKEGILKGQYKINIKVKYRGDKGKGDNYEKHNHGQS